MQIRSVLFLGILIFVGSSARAAEPPLRAITADATFARWFAPGTDPLEALRRFEQVKSDAAQARLAAADHWAEGKRRFSDPGVAFLFPFFLPDGLGKLPAKPYLATPEGYADEILEADGRASLRALFAAALTDEAHLGVLTRMAREYRKIALLPQLQSTARADLDDFAKKTRETDLQIAALERLRQNEQSALRSLGGPGEVSLKHLPPVPAEGWPVDEEPLSSWEERQARVLSIFAWTDSWEAQFGLVNRAEILPVDEERDPFAHFLSDKEYSFFPFHIREARLTSYADRPLRDRTDALAEEQPRLLAALRNEIRGISEELPLTRKAEGDAAKAYGEAYGRFASGAVSLPELLRTGTAWADASHRRVELERDLDEARIRLACATTAEEEARAKK
jgi:hypothetical protein